MQLFYGHKQGDRFELTPDESRHAVKVLRKKTGDTLSAIDGLGNLYTGPLVSDSSHQCVIQIEKITSDWGLLPYTMHLAVAPTKNMDRLEWLCEKAVEVGVTRITPLLCSRSERKVLKPERLERILLSASKQSMKGRLPLLDPLTPFRDFVAEDLDIPRYIAHCAEGEKKHLAIMFRQNPSSCVIIGPEGDFTPEEIKLAEKQNIPAVTLGESRLRTETAALAAVHTAAVMFGLQKNQD